MCCFSQPVESVTNTRIFARMGEGIHQFIVYSMALEAKQDLAMVLPIPVAPGSGENAVRFLNLEKYPGFFDHFATGFPVPRSYHLEDAKSAMAVAAPLEVHSVGSYDASFVPTIADFGRLNQRFRLRDEVWSKLPGYRQYGFAVFKLKRGKSEVHPMAFSFPSATPERLFFPTMHIHDGEVHAKEEYDHVLYGQAAGLPGKLWEESPGIASQFVRCELTHGIVHPMHHVYRQRLLGMQENGDVLVKARKLA